MIKVCIALFLAVMLLMSCSKSSTEKSEERVPMPNPVQDSASSQVHSVIPSQVPSSSSEYSESGAPFTSPNSLAGVDTSDMVKFYSYSGHIPKPNKIHEWVSCYQAGVPATCQIAIYDISDTVRTIFTIICNGTAEYNIVLEDTEGTKSTITSSMVIKRAYDYILGADNDSEYWRNEWGVLWLPYEYLSDVHLENYDVNKKEPLGEISPDEAKKRITGIVAAYWASPSFYLHDKEVVLSENDSVELTGAIVVNGRVFYEFCRTENGVYPDGFCIDADTGNIVLMHSAAHSNLYPVDDKGQQIIDLVA